MRPDGVAVQHDGLAPLRGVLTLGIYRQAANVEAGQHLRPFAEVGQIISRAKYTRSDGPRISRDDALARLSELLCEQLATHAFLAGTNRLVGCPSTSSGFSDGLARYVHELSGIGLEMAVDLRPGGKTRKDRPAPRDYRVDGDLSGCSVVVVDDVFGEGVTMRALGVAAMRAGADGVAGLAAARKLAT